MLNSEVQHADSERDEDGGENVTTANEECIDGLLRIVFFFTGRGKEEDVAHRIL